MKKFIILFSLCIPAMGYAAEFMSDEIIDIQDAQTDDVYALAESISISGELSQDLYALGKGITITSAIQDDVHLIGETITVSSDIQGDLFVVGQNVIITSPSIQGDVYVLSQSVNISAANISGDIHITTDTLRLSSSIAGNADLIYGDVSISDDTSIGGDLSYTGEKSTQLESITTGTASHQTQKEGWGMDMGKGFGTMILGLVISKFFTLLTCSLILFWMLHSYFRDLVTTAKSRVLVSMGTGFLFGLVTPILIVVMFMIWLTAPLAIVLSGIYLSVLFILGESLAIVFIYQLIRKTQSKQIINILLYVLIVAGFTLISGLDIVLVWWMIGAIILKTYAQLGTKKRKKK